MWDDYHDDNDDDGDDYNDDDNDDDDDDGKALCNKESFCGQPKCGMSNTGQQCALQSS